MNEVCVDLGVGLFLRGTWNYLWNMGNKKSHMCEKRSEKSQKTIFHACSENDDASVFSDGKKLVQGFKRRFHGVVLRKMGRFILCFSSPIFGLSLCFGHLRVHSSNCRRVRDKLNPRAS